MEIIGTKTVAQTEARLRQRDTFDVAVIDLAWNGDPNLSSDKKADAGLNLLRLISEENKKARDYKPAIAFSQNFRSDLELVAIVLENGALPVQKEYTELGHRMLGAAIKLLARGTMPPESNRRLVEGLSSGTGGLTLSQLISAVPISQLWTAGTALVGAAAALAGVAFWLGKTLGGHGS